MAILLNLVKREATLFLIVQAELDHSGITCTGNLRPDYAPSCSISHFKLTDVGPVLSSLHVRSHSNFVYKPGPKRCKLYYVYCLFDVQLLAIFIPILCKI